MSFAIKILGNIATGKTTLARLLASELRISARLEHPLDNPFLPRTVADPSRWCFANQAWFANEATMSEALRNERGVVFDHSIEEVIDIHTPVFHNLDWLDTTEVALLHSLWPRREPVELYIHLVASPETLIHRVVDRSRSGDRPPDAQYLDAVERSRSEFLLRTSVPVITIESDKNDFRGADDIRPIAARIRSLVDL